MDTKKKSANFTKNEVEMLVDEVEENREILFGKLSSTLTAHMKHSVWEKITEKINAVSCVFRTEKAVRKKWADMSSLMKKKEAARRREMSATGGGECSGGTAQSDTDKKIIGLLCDEAIEGIVGGIDVGIEAVVADDRQMFDETQLSSCGQSYVTEASLLVVPVQDDGKMHGQSGKSGYKRQRERDSQNVEELTRLEKRRLEVEEERLAVEKCRLAVEKERLKLEQERWLWEKNRHTTMVDADE